MSAILFWTAIAILFYTFVIFSGLIILRGIIIPKPIIQDDIFPTVTMVIAAYNEERNIAEKIENSLALDYPADKLEILIGSDGSTDRTAEIIQQYNDHRIRFFDLPRSGKNGVLNSIVPHAKGEILVFSDANSMYSKNAIRALTRRFADPGVGGVAGNQTYSLPEKGAAGEPERVYWNYDQMLKEYQSHAGNVTSATGAIYAIRTPLFQKIERGMDDVFISTGVVAQGYRLVYAKDAITYEPPASSSNLEYKRKVRNIMLGLEAVLFRNRLLNPFKFGFYSIQIFTHKILRRMIFLPLVVLLLTSPLLWNDGVIYQITTITQLIFYCLALIGFILEKNKLGEIIIFSIPFYVVMVYIASMIATLNLLKGRRIQKWETNRSGS